MQNSIKEEVYKCSKCGLCQSVCPIFLAQKNEMFLPRGRFIVLNNYFNNNIPLNKQFIKNLDICLNCNACKRFCPSNLDSYKIFTIIKSEFNYKYSFISFSLLYKIFLNILRVFRYLYMYFPVKSIFINTLADLIFDEKVKPDAVIKKNNQNKNVVYFEGCINKYINPSDKNAALNILKNAGYKILKINSNCCGLPYLCDGNIKTFDKNIKKIEKSIPKNTDYVVCSCDSCFETLEKTALKGKLIRLDEILKLNNIEIPKNENVIYHKPLARETENYIEKNIKVINQKGSCSLGENFFILKHPVIAQQMIKKVFYDRKITDNKTVITTSLPDMIGIKLAIHKQKGNAKVFTLAEYICKNKK